MLTNGITGFRQMSGSEELLRRRRTGTLNLPEHSPDLLAMPGAVLTPLNASTGANAAAAVREQHAAGADFIKAALVGRDAFDEAQAEANRLRIPLVGHLPVGIDVLAAARAGLRAIEHLGPGVTMFAASCRDPALATDLAAQRGISLPKIKVPFMDRIVGRLLRKIVINPANLTTSAGIDQIQRAIDTFDEDLAAQFAADITAAGTWQCPTLIRIRTQQLCDAPQFRGDPHLEFVAAATRTQWEASAHKFESKFTDQQRATYRAFYDLQRRMLKILANAGSPLIAGTDTVGAAWVVPGFSLHDEFRELASAGLDPLRILQMTTSAAAAFLDRSATLGSVAVGKQGDLVVLDADPLTDVTNLGRIHAVVRGGRPYRTEDLTAITRSVADATPAK